MAIVDELVTLIGVDIDPSTMEKLKGIKDKIDQLYGVMVKTTLAATAMGTALGYWLAKTATNSRELLNLSQMTGMSTDSIQELGYAVEQLGGSSESLESDLQGLQQTLSSPIPGQFNETLAMMGVAALDAGRKMRPMEDVLADIAEVLQQKPTGEAFQWGARLGLSQDTIRLLLQGKEGMKALREQARAMGAIISKESMQNAVEFDNSLKNIWAKFKVITKEIGLNFMPSLHKVLDKWNEWIRANRDWLSQRTREIIEGIALGFDKAWMALMKLKDALVDIFKSMTKNLGSGKDLKKIIADIVEKMLMALPVIVTLWLAMHADLVIVAAALYVVGWAMTEILGKKDSLEEVKNILWGFALAGADIADAFMVVKDLLSSVVSLAMGLASWLTYIVGYVTKLGEMPGRAAQWVAKKLGASKTEQIETRPSDEIFAYADALSQVAEELQSTQGQEARGGSYRSKVVKAMEAKAPKGGDVMTNNNQQITINVNGVSDPNQAANAVVRKLKASANITPGKYVLG